MVERRRALTGNRPIGKKDFARAILKALAANQAVGILIDQNAALDTGVFVDFFGVPASRGHGLRQVRGAQRGGGDSRLRAVERAGAALRPALLPAAGDDRRCARDTQTLQSKLEEVIREYPGPVAVDPPPLEDASARRGVAV